jgi:single-strand DNA-binding protein
VSKEKDMAGTFNEVLLIGVCQDEPDFEYGNGPDPTVSFQLYTEEHFNNSSREATVRRETHHVELYEDAGEEARSWGLSQGCLVGVLGRFISRGRDGADGKKIYKSAIRSKRFLPLVKTDDVKSVMTGHLNHIVLIGRLGNDPDVRYSAQGTPVTNASLATDHPVKNGDKWNEETTWHRLVFWGRLAEVVGKYLSKGRPMGAQGNLKTRSWEDDQCERRRITEVNVETMQMLPSSSNAKGSDKGPDDQIEDDVPF